MAYSKGTYALAISDRSGVAFKYTEMVKEWTGALVHTSEYEPKQPQLMPQRHSPDPQALHNPRPARTEFSVPHMLPLNPFRFTASSTTIKVFSPSHGRTTADTVRFRDSDDPLFGADVDELNSASGYSITVVDDDFYTFVVTTAPSSTGNGGGGSVSAGPLTITP